MRKISTRILVHAFAVLLLMGCIPMRTSAAAGENWITYAAENYAGGTGTADDPYQIATPEQLAKLAADTNSAVGGRVPEGTDYFRLTADIDLSGKLWTPIGAHMGGNSMAAFYGHFDGNGKAISNMTVDMRGRAVSEITPSGLFGAIVANHTDYTVQNLTISGAKVYAFETKDASLDDYVNSAGVLAAYIAAGGGGNGCPIIKNCKVSDSLVNGSEKVGGLFGNVSYAQISDCSISDTEVTGNGWTGGFVGYGFLCEINNGSVENGTVNGTWSTGGFAGVISGGTVENCTVSGEVAATDWRCGGFVGYMEQFDNGLAMKNCSTTATVKSNINFDGEPRVGGFAGEINSATEISDCKALGEVVESYDDKNTVGKFVGRAAADELNFQNCEYDNRLHPEQKIIGNRTVHDAEMIRPNYADYGAVDAAIQAALALNKDLYQNYTAVSDAINAVDRSKKRDEQAIVDGYAAAINAAVAALEYKPADYSAVDEAVAKASGLKPADYEDFSAVTNAIKAIERNKNITEQAVVDAYAKAVQDAINALVPKKAPVAKPEIIEGANQSVEQGKAVVFRSSAELRDFIKVLIDDVEISRDKYTLTEGSTIVTLSGEFIKTLSVGKHTLSIVSTNGSADTEFNVVNSSSQEEPGTPAQTTEPKTSEGTADVAAENLNANVKAPKTGDDTIRSMGIWVLIMAIGVLGLQSVKHSKLTK